jgi:hypothetical protein
MPAIVSVQPRDIYFLVEFSLEEMKKLKKVMDLTSISFDGTIQEEKDAAEYFSGKFYDFIKESLKEIERGSDSE